VTPPTVAITEPTDGATVTGLVPLAATATDDMSDVAKVEFAVDGVVVATDMTDPYSATWDSATAAPGSHTITAKATDGADLVASASVTVNVPTAPPPPPPPPPVVSESTSLTAAATPARVTVGATSVLRATLRANGTPVGDRTDVSVWKKARSRWSRVGVAAYDSSTGQYALSVSPSASSTYQFRFPGDTSYRASVSNSVTVYVTKKVRVRRYAIRYRCR
jgi:Bacterial Ig domain